VALSEALKTLATVKINVYLFLFCAKLHNMKHFITLVTMVDWFIGINMRRSTCKHVS